MRPGRLRKGERHGRSRREDGRVEVGGRGGHPARNRRGCERWQTHQQREAGPKAEDSVIVVGRPGRPCLTLMPMSFSSYARIGRQRRTISVTSTLTATLPPGRYRTGRVVGSAGCSQVPHRLVSRGPPRTPETPILQRDWPKCCVREDQGCNDQCDPREDRRRPRTPVGRKDNAQDHCHRTEGEKQVPAEHQVAPRGPRCPRQERDDGKRPAQFNPAPHTVFGCVRWRRGRKTPSGASADG